MKDENNAKKEIDPEIKAIGERIRAARKAKGLTMEKLAEAALNTLKPSKRYS